MPDRSHVIRARLARLFIQVRAALRGAPADPRREIPLLARLTAHLGIIALVIVGLLVGGVEIRAAGPDPNAPPDSSNELGPIQYPNSSDTGDIVPDVIPFTPSSQPQPARLDIVQYTVAANDTVTSIAARFHVSANTILWANDKLLDDPDMLSIGQNLNIPPTIGVLYTVQKGDTLQGIAAVFKAKVDDILNDPYNRSNHDFKSNPPRLAVGSFLMVPGGTKPFVAGKTTVPITAITRTAPTGAARGTSNFIMPAPGACISQIFWARHSGIDLAAPLGTPIYAADSGFVQIVGWDNTGYGNMILINHGNGYWTRYGHLSAFNVEPGQSVKKGDFIGRVGSTGHSTGPHLHFEIILFGAPRDPAPFLGARLPRHCPGY